MRKYLLALIGFLPVAALAAYDTAHLPYTDAPSDRVTAVAVSMLTEEGILQGHPDGTFRPNQLVNRAEFLKIAQRTGSQEFVPPTDTACFPDIDPATWYAPFVCAAKRDGIVRGDALEGVLKSAWRFHPTRTVNYAEALKMLTAVLNVPLAPPSTPARDWFEPLIRTARNLGVNLPGAMASSTLTRGEVAQVVASFLAYSRGELTMLRAAQEGKASSSSSSRVEDLRSSSSVSSVSSASSVSSFATDPGPGFSQLPSFLRLGTVSSILGAAKIFNNSEPFTVEDITVTFTGTVPSVDQVRLYASADGRYLGGASRDSSDPSSFTLHSSSGLLSMARRVETSVYARAITRGFDQGGTGGEDIQIDHFFIEGRGDWSNRRYSQSTTETYQTFETARSVFTSIVNAGPAEDVLVGGVGRTLGQWRFEGVRGDGSADLGVTDIDFSLGVSGGVILSNVTLGADGTSERASCSVAGDTVTCSPVPEGIGTIVNGTRILTLRGDITIPASSQSAGLQVALTPAGSVSSVGALTWTDGTTSFSWVPFDESQLRGTFYRF
ncbi:MAG: S-layer homology domain-containing protein [Candidatus Peregrinibacteria bacterium]